MSPDSFDAAVVRAAAQGDEPAFTRVFRAVQPVVLRYLRTLAGDAAEDLAAETWVHVIRGLPRFEGDESGFRAWVVTIARSRWVDHVRRAGRAPETLDDSHAVDLPARRQVEDQVEELFSTEEALALIRRLPPDQAEVLVLRIVADLDVAATAAVVGRRPGTVRVLAHRGLRRLEQMLRSAEVGRPVGVTHADRSSVTGES